MLSVFAEDARDGRQKYEEESLAPDVQPVKSQPKAVAKYALRLLNLGLIYNREALGMRLS